MLSSSSIGLPICNSGFQIQISYVTLAIILSGEIACKSNPNSFIKDIAGRGQTFTQAPQPLHLLLSTQDILAPPEI